MAAFSRRYGRNRAAVLGLCILGAVVLLALAAPWISPGSPFRLAGKPLSPPFGEYLFGTDTLGRDVAGADLPNCPYSRAKIFRFAVR